jgi:hypothetical protein
MPAVNYDLMLQEMLRKTQGKVGQAHAVLGVLPVGSESAGERRTVADSPRAGRRGVVHSSD